MSTTKHSPEHRFCIKFLGYGIGIKSKYIPQLNEDGVYTYEEIFKWFNSINEEPKTILVRSIPQGEFFDELCTVVSRFPNPGAMKWKFNKSLSLKEGENEEAST